MNALAPGLNTMPLTSTVGHEVDACSIVRTSKVAVSPGPLGTVPGTQLFTLNQSPVAGIVFQVALPAKLLFAVASRSVRIAAVDGRKALALGRRNDYLYSLAK